jgi:hypothetical protein
MDDNLTQFIDGINVLRQDPRFIETPAGRQLSQLVVARDMENLRNILVELINQAGSVDAILAFFTAELQQLPTRDNYDYFIDQNDDDMEEPDWDQLGDFNVGGDLKGVLKGIKQAFTGTRDNWPPKSRAVLEKYGNIPFTEVAVCRKPLQKALNNAINLLKKAKGYDSFFHLSISFKLTSGEWLRLDKREVLSATTSLDYKGAECISVKADNSTVNEVLAKTLKKVGNERFFKYRATSYNCQRFVLDIIEANHMQTDEKFILQPVSNLLPKYVDGVANFFTDLSSKFDLLTQGYGLYSGVRDPSVRMRMFDIYKK